jgi:hypothetical protein
MREAFPAFAVPLFVRCDEFFYLFARQFRSGIDIGGACNKRLVYAADNFIGFRRAQELRPRIGNVERFDEPFHIIALKQGIVKGIYGSRYAIAFGGPFKGIFFLQTEFQVIFTDGFVRAAVIDRVAKRAGA